MPNTKPNKEAEAFGRRLVALLEGHGQPRRGAGSYLSRRYKVSNVVANAWLNGEYKPEIPKAKEIADDHGESFDSLYFGESGKAAADNPWADVTAYAQAAGLGTGPEAAEWAETHRLKFRKDSLARKRLNPKHLAVMYGAGDSMEPGISAGDAILFDTTDTTPKNKGVYVLLVPGAGAEEYVVKRAIVSKGNVTFVADNPDGDHGWKEPRRMETGIKVIGRVRWTGGWVK